MDTPIIPSEKQRIALSYLYDNTTNFIGYGGSGFSGKSYVLTRWITNMCLQYPGVGYGIARKTLIDLKKTTLLTLFKVFKECNITDGRDYNYNGQLNTIEFFNGSTIFLIEMAYKPSDPLFTRLGGYELTGAGVDESVECPIEAINILFTRLGRRENKKYNITSKLLETFNPAKNHVYRRYYKPDREGIIKDTYKFVPALPADNPSPETKEYVQGIIDNSDKITIERLIYGNFEYDDDPAKLMEYDNIVDLFTNDFVGKDENGELIPCDNYISADIARFGSDLTVLMAWKGYRVVEIQSYERTSITDSADHITDMANKYGVPRSRIVVDEDGLGCMVKGTQVLTTDGFKPVQQLKKGDKIYSKDKNQNMIEETIINYEKRNDCEVLRTDNGYEFSSGQIMPYKTRDEYPFKYGSWDKILSGIPKFLDIKANWKGTDRNIKFASVKYKMPHGGIKDLHNEIDIRLKDFAAFLGWFISDGGISEDKYIVIRQKWNNGNKCDIIESVLNRCSFKFNKKRDKTGVIIFSFGHKNLRKWLVDNCYNIKRDCKHIKVPDIIRHATSSTIKEFLYHFRLGDGWLHHGMDYYGTSSKQLADDLQELIYKTGRYCGQKLKYKAGSESVIEGRKIKRTADHYYIYETKNKNITTSNKNIKKSIEDVYFMDISGATRLFLIKTSNNRMFWVHNGGVVDILKCKGFVANSTPIEVKGKKENYNNLKSQCYFRLAEKVNKNEIFIDCVDTTVIEKITEELEVVKQKDIDKDNKMAIIPKDKVKELIGRSPDFSDALAMRFFLDLKKTGILATV